MDNKKLNDIKIELLPSLPKEILDAYERRELVVFIGAGISRLMGCEGWESMSNRLIRQICPASLASQIIGSELKSDDKITIAKRYSERNGTTDKFWEVFAAAIKPDQNSIDIYKNIARLKTPFITTNCDGLLLKYFPTHFTTDCTVDNYQINDGKQYVYCIHGNYGEGRETERASLIFCIDEYLKAYAYDSSLVSFLRYIMRKNTVLFLGYGLTEFGILNAAFEKEGEVKHYVLEGFFNYQKEYCDAVASYYSSAGIKLIAYSKDDKEYKQQYDIIGNWIDELIRKTSYLSHVSSDFEKLISAFNEENCNQLRIELDGCDELAQSKKMNFLDCLISSENCFQWLDFLIEAHIIYSDELFDNDDNNAKLRSKAIESIKICLKKYDIQNIDVLKQYITKCVNSKIEIICREDNSFIAYAFSHIYILLRMAPISENEKKLFHEMAMSFDSGLSILEKNILLVKDNWTSESIVWLFSDSFTSIDSRNNSQRTYHFKQLTKIITSSFAEDIIAEIGRKCFERLMSTTEKNDFYNSFEDRYRYGANLEDYYGSLVEVIKELLHGVKSEKLKETILVDIFKDPKCSFDYQAAFYFFRYARYYKLYEFGDNPLNYRHLYPDFYVWLYDARGSLSYKEKEKVFNWIKSASFGISIIRENDEDVIWCKKRIRTYQYYLLSLLSCSEADILLKEGIFEEKTPIQDHESFYSIRTLPTQYDKYDYINSSIADILKHIFEGQDASTQNRFWNISEKFNECFKMLDGDKIICILTQLSNDINEDAIIPTLSALSSHDVLSKIPKDNLCAFIELLIDYGNKSLLSEDYYHHIIDFLSAVSSDHFLTSIQTFDYLLKIDYYKFFRNNHKTKYKYDSLNELFNDPEGRYYCLILESGYDCRNDRKDSILKCLSVALNNHNTEWVNKALAFYFTRIYYIDSDFTQHYVLDSFNKQSDDVKMQIGCLLCYSELITDEAAKYIFEMIKPFSQYVFNGNEKEKETRHVVNFIVAAYYYNKSVSEDYKTFLHNCGKNPEVIKDIFWSLFSGIKNHDAERTTEVYKETRDILLETIPKEDVCKAVVERLSFISDTCMINDCYWEEIENMIPEIAQDAWTWRHIDSCIKNTNAYNKHIKSIIDKMCEENRKVSTPKVYEYEIRSIIKHLAKINALEEIKAIARFAVLKDICGKLFADFIEHPEKAKDLPDE